MIIELALAWESPGAFDSLRSWAADAVFVPGEYGTHANVRLLGLSLHLHFSKDWA